MACEMMSECTAAKSWSVARTYCLHVVHVLRSIGLLDFRPCILDRHLSNAEIGEVGDDAVDVALLSDVSFLRTQLANLGRL